jgi:hypothetical protein
MNNPKLLFRGSLFCNALLLIVCGILYFRVRNLNRQSAERSAFRLSNFIHEPSFTDLQSILLNSKNVGSKPRGRNIFIDAGSNNGQSINYFVTGVTGDNGGVQGGYSNFGGLGKGNNFHIYAIEPNRKYRQDLHDLKTKLTAANLVAAFHVFALTAIASKTGPSELIADNVRGDGPGAGSTLM